MNRAAAVVAVALAAGPAWADRDLQQWTELGVNHDVTKRVGLSLAGHLRFDEDVSRVEAIMPEAGVAYRLTKWFRIGAGYRLQYSRDKDGVLGVRHRFHAYGKVRRDLGPARFEYKLQFQEQLRPGANDPLRHTVRNRFELAYRDLKPWIPAVATELFVAVDDGDPAHLDKLGFVVDLAHAGKERTVDVFYRVELPIADRMDPTIHILGLGAQFDL